MTIRDLQGRLFQPGFIADIPSGNLVWVDPVNGNDDLAVRGRMTVPFKTLTKAKTAAVSGDTIVVFPGTYSEKNLLKNGVNWHFMPGAKITYSGASAGGVFDDSSNGSNGAVTSLITGYAEISVSATTGTAHIVCCSASSSNLTIQVRSMYSGSNSTIKITSGSCVVEVLEDIGTATSDVIVFSASSLQNRVQARVISTSGGYGLVASSGSGRLDLTAHRIVSSSNTAVALTGGTGSLVIRAYEIESMSSDAIYYNAATNPGLTVIGARIISSFNNANGNSINVASGGSNVIKLAGCSLLSTHASSLSIKAASATTIQFHGLTVGQRGATNLTAVPSTGWVASQAIT